MRNGWYLIGICALAAFLLYGTGSFVLFWIAIVSGVICFWTFGIMHNYANDPDAAPDWAAIMNFFSTVTGIALLLIAIYRTFISKDG